MPLQISRIHAICFDVDGTISDTDDVYVQKVERILHPIRILFPRQDVTAGCPAPRDVAGSPRQFFDGNL